MVHRPWRRAVPVTLRVRAAGRKKDSAYIAASDLIPEVKHDRRLRNNLVHFGAFVGGISVIVLTRALLEG